MGENEPSVEDQGGHPVGCCCGPCEDDRGDLVNAQCAQFSSSPRVPRVWQFPPLAVTRCLRKLFLTPTLFSSLPRRVEKEGTDRLVVVL